MATMATVGLLRMMGGGARVVARVLGGVSVPRSVGEVPHGIVVVSVAGKMNRTLIAFTSMFTGPIGGSPVMVCVMGIFLSVPVVAVAGL